MKRDPLVYLWDVSNAAEAIQRFIDGKHFSDYETDDMLRSAVERQFEIIGEVLNQLNKVAPDIGKNIPSLREIVSFRNLLIHGYASINHQMVWQTAQVSLPELLDAVSELIEDMDES